MKKAKAGKVPVLENAFELNLPKLMRAAKASGGSRLVLDDGVVRTVALLSPTRLAVHLAGRVWLVDIVAVACQNGRLRSLLKCPRAHEGNFQSLYLQGGELACRLCHALRYRSNLASTPPERARLARYKLITKMGGELGTSLPKRRHRMWNVRYKILSERLERLSEVHYNSLARSL